MTMKVASFQEEKLRGEAMFDGLNMSVRLTGTGDLRVVGRLDEFLTKVHAEAEQVGVQQVSVDLKELEFMNSSCFKTFVSWLGRVQESKRPYKVRLQASDKFHWQKRSLHALKCFAADHVIIE
jgi:hypothetical protein